MKDETKIRKSKARKRIKDIWEPTIKSTKKAAVKYLANNLSIKGKTALATAYFVNHKQITAPEAAEKFNVHRGTIYSHAEELADLNNVAKEDYIPDKGVGYKDYMEEIISKFDWEEGEEYTIYDNSYRINRKGEMKLLKIAKKH